MKKIIINIILLFALLLNSNNIKSQTVYASITSGNWSDATTWETYATFSSALAATPGSGTAATTIPSGTHNVVIRSGHTISMNGANRGCKGIIINTGGKLWANETSDRRLQIGAGGTGFAYPLVDTVQIDGIIGGAGDGCYFEIGAAAQLVKIWGTGSVDLSRLRCPGGIGSTGGGSMTIDVDINMNFWKSANYALSLVYNPALTDNYTLNIKPGKTITIKSADGYFHNSQNTATYGRYTYNIQGALDLTLNTQTLNYLSSSLIAPAGAGSNLTVNVDGGFFKAGAGMKMDTSTTGPISEGVLDFNVINGGVVDLTATSSLRVGKSTNGAGGVNSMFFGTDATGKIKTNAGIALIPIGINTATSSNNVRIINIGTADAYNVGLKSTFDNAPTDPTIVVNRQWSIAETVAGGSNDTLKLSWIAAHQAASFDPAQPIAIMHWTGSAWVNIPAAISGTGVTDDPYVATATGVSNYNSSFFGVTNIVSVTPAPTVSSLTPNSLCSSTGGTITITGTDFTGATGVTIGSTAAVSYTVVSATQITAVVGAGVSGIVSVTTSAGSSTGTSSLSLNTPTTPAFNQVAAICAGGSFTLPTVSSNGINGSWSPNINNQTTTTYTFTPDAGQCATTASIIVTVTASTVPVFTQVAAICAGGSFTLPTVSGNGINGNWSPNINNQTTTTYTFTPTSGNCVSTATMTVDVNPTSNSAVTQTACGSYTWNGTTYTTSGDYTHSNGTCSVDTLHLTISPSVTPAFTQVAAICASGSFTLPSTSNNGISGAWSPNINNQTTTTYTFTPASGNCVSTATMTVAVNPTSNNAVTQTACGSYTWNGTTYTTGGDYTHTNGACSVDTLHLTITPSVTPAFTQVAPILVDGSFTLPATSNNGITGAWSPAINNQVTTTYTFTPDAGQCASITTMTVTVNPVTTTNAVIYANPTTDGIVTVNWTNAKIQNYRIVMITVFDRNGRLVFKNDNLSSGSGISVNVDLGLKKYSNGVYLIKIETADNSVVYTTKIVLARK